MQSRRVSLVGASLASALAVATLGSAGYAVADERAPHDPNTGRSRSRRLSEEEALRRLQARAERDDEVAAWNKRVDDAKRAKKGGRRG